MQALCWIFFMYVANCTYILFEILTENLPNPPFVDITYPVTGKKEVTMYLKQYLTIIST